MNFRPSHLLLAVCVHALLFVMLTAGVKCTPEIKQPAAIQGILLDPNREQQAQIQKAQIEKQHRAEIERERREQEAEEARAAEQRKQAELKQAELKRAEEEIIKKRKMAENLKKEKDERAKKETAKRRKLEEEQRRKKQEQQKALEKNEQDMRNQELEADAAAAAQSLAVRTARSEWEALVAALVRKNWRRPPDASDDFVCKVQIEQLPGGQIQSRKMVQSCGNLLLDESVLKAIDKSNPLPLVSNPAAFQRTLVFSFCPNC